MPKTTKKGAARQDELPDAINRSDAKAQGSRESVRGVDANASKKHLYERAEQVDLPGRSRKQECAHSGASKGQARDRPGTFLTASR
jgi:hypothetical protein